MVPLTSAIPEHIRGGYDDVLYKSTFTLQTDRQTEIHTMTAITVLAIASRG